MNILGVCPYETPCGWCSKWDKKCDGKIGKENIINIKPVDYAKENDELLKERKK